jgi:hypothetical protein
MRLPLAGALALIGALTILLALPLTSFGTRRPNSTRPGAVAGAVAAVPRAVGAVTGTVQHVIAASPVAGVVRATGVPVGAVGAAPVRQGDALKTGTLSTPAMYGTNPAGMGTVASLFINPSATIPYPYKPGGAHNEILVVGRGRSEQQANGSYDAHTTIAALLGTELLGVNATEGQSNTGPLNALQQKVLNKICTSSMQNVCLSVLAADTAATTTGASTHFAVATIAVGNAKGKGLATGLASSDSTIKTTTGGCQTATGSSQAANIMLGGGQVASLGKSSESATACAGQTPAPPTAASQLLSLGGIGVKLPAAGCASGAPNTQAGLLPPVLSIICNADSTTQLATPAGVREALTVIALEVANSALLKTSVVAAQAHAVAQPTTGPGGKPPGGGNHHHHHGGGKTKGHHHKRSGGGGQKCTDRDHDCGKGGGHCPSDAFDNDGDCNLPNGGGSEGGAENEAAGGPTAHVSGALPFTGENVLEVVLLGLVLASGGLALSSRTKRKRT